MPPQRVEIVIGVRTLLTLVAFGLCVVLAILSLGALLSIFLAAVVALGLDPVVAALQRRGWKRGRAALAAFAALFAAVFLLVVAAAGPVWGEVVDFVDALPGYWDDLRRSAWFRDLTGTAGFDDRVRDALAD